MTATSKAIAVVQLPAKRAASSMQTDEQTIRLWLHGKAQNSQRAYTLDVTRFRASVPKPLPTVTLEDLQRFADSLVELAPASQRRILSAVKSLLGFCQKIGYCRFNVGAPLTLRAAKNTLAERILPSEDVARIIEREDNRRDHVMLRFLYETGARVSEVCGLKWRDVQPRDSGLAQITVFGKGDKTRHVLISKRLYKKLVALRGDADENSPVFPSKTGKHLDEPRVFRIVRAAAEHAGITAKVSPHWFRHCAASHSLDGGAPVHLVQQQLGHASLDTTSRYVHARPGDGLFRYLS